MCFRSGTLGLEASNCGRWFSGSELTVRWLPARQLASCHGPWKRACTGMRPLCSHGQPDRRLVALGLRNGISLGGRQGKERDLDSHHRGFLYFAVADVYELRFLQDNHTGASKKPEISHK